MNAFPSPAHVALLEPEIPWNTGNAGRSCVAFGAQLHLIGPLGFRLDERSVKRAGLDYWPLVKPQVWIDWGEYQSNLDETQRLYAITPEGETALWDADLKGPVTLLFGKESHGLPDPIRRSFDGLRIPMPAADAFSVRSLNVSTCVGIVLAEWARQNRDIDRR